MPWLLAAAAVVAHVVFAELAKSSLRSSRYAAMLVRFSEDPKALYAYIENHEYPATTRRDIGSSEKCMQSAQWAVLAAMDTAKLIPWFCRGWYLQRAGMRHEEAVGLAEMRGDVAARMVERMKAKSKESA